METANRANATDGLRNRLTGSVLCNYGDESGFQDCSYTIIDVMQGGKIGKLTGVLHHADGLKKVALCRREDDFADNNGQCQLKW